MQRSDSQIRAVIFDFGNVLIGWDPRNLYRKIFDDAGEMERFLREVGFDEWNRALDSGLSYAEGVERLSGRFPHYAEQIAAFHHRWEESISGPIEGSVEIARELRERGYPLYGLTNWSAETFGLVYGKHQFFRWFDPIVMSGEEGVCKPDPQIYRTLLQRTGRSPEECLFIDDSAANVEGAERLGIAGIVFRSPAELRAELERRGLLA